MVETVIEEDEEVGRKSRGNMIKSGRGMKRMWGKTKQHKRRRTK